MIEIQRAEAKESGMENWNWETFMEVDSYKEASQQLAKFINDWDAIGDFFRVIESGIPAESRYGREPDKVKPLAQYLDEYIEHESELDHIEKTVAYMYAYNSWRELLEQALDAYQSTENVIIKIERNV